MSWQASLVKWLIKRKMQPADRAEGTFFGVTTDPRADIETAAEQVRRELDEWAASMPGPPKGTVVTRVVRETVRGEWIVAPDFPEDTGRAILYLHGGGFFWNNLAVARNMLGRLSRLTRARVFALEYRLAPACPYPAALDDAKAAIDWLRDDQDIRAENLFVGGESAGGGLAVSLLSLLAREGGTMPAAMFLFSPWSDLTVGGGGATANAGADPMLSAADLTWSAGLYLDGADAAAVSPLALDLAGLPPTVIQVGSTEILLDDSKRLAAAISDAGGTCRLEIWPGMHHVWQQQAFFLPEGREALATIANFICSTPASARN